MDQYSIINKVNEIISFYNDIPFCNIYIRFYIRDKLFETFKIVKGFSFSYRGVSFGLNLFCLLNNNLHFSCFDYVSAFLCKGRVTCHGHGEFYSIDKIIINFNRGD